MYFGCYGLFFFFQAEDGIRDAQESRGLGDVYKRQPLIPLILFFVIAFYLFTRFHLMGMADTKALILILSLIHI